MTSGLLAKINLLVHALFNDTLKPDDSISLTNLVRKPKNIPLYNRQGIPDYWGTDRTAGYYIKRVFGDDLMILHRLGIKPQNKRHIFWEANSCGTDLDYFDIWVAGGLDPDGPMPYKEKVDYRSPEVRYDGFLGFFSLNCALLELGSGEGISLAQFYNGLKYRDQLVWIGIDKQYPAGEIDMGKRGELQFVQDDFHELGHVPDSSIDRILSVQSAFTHGDVSRVSEQLTRISKQGAILRALPLMDYLKGAINSLTANGWDIYTIGEEGLVARLK